MIWFGAFLAGVVIIAYGLVKALRSRKPDMWMANGGFVAAIGFMGFSTWPVEVVPSGMDQKAAGLMLMWWGGWGACAWAAYQLLWSLRALAWPSVPGTITRSEAVFMGINNSTIIGPRGSTKHWWSVTYSYAVDGKSFTSSNKALDIDDQDSTFSSVTNMVAKHPVGSTITVYHHPSDPGLVCIDRGWFNARWCVPVMFAAIMLWVAWPG